jgi:transcriptional regulator with XRE-family HTH domain
MVKVKAWRKKEKKRQADVAGMLGISQGVYSRYEAMKTVMPPALVMLLISKSKGALKTTDFYSWLEAAGWKA